MKKPIRSLSIKLLLKAQSICYFLIEIISAPNAYLILTHSGVALIRGRHLKESGTCFKAKERNHIKLQNLIQKEKKTKSFTSSKPKYVEISKYKQYLHCFIVYLFST